MKYDVYEDRHMHGKTTSQGKVEGFVDALGATLEGLASWVGLDSLLREWNSNTHIKTKDKIQQLRTKIKALVARGDINLEALDKKIESLNLGNFNLTGRAAQVAGNYKTELQKKRENYSKQLKSDQIEYDKMLQDLDKADEGASKLSLSGARTSSEIAHKVEQAIGGTKQDGIL